MQLKKKNSTWMIGSQTKKIVIFLSLIFIFASGCKTTMVNDFYPIIPVPERPKISSELNKEDFKSLAKYAQKLEVSIEKYNEYAAEKNKKAEEFLNKE